MVDGLIGVKLSRARAEAYAGVGIIEIGDGRCGDLLAIDRQSDAAVIARDQRLVPGIIVNPGKGLPDRVTADSVLGNGDVVTLHRVAGCSLVGVELHALAGHG